MLGKCWKNQTFRKGKQLDHKFYLFKRKNGFFYAELFIEGKRIVRSTKESNKNKAAIVAAQWFAGGIPEAQGKKTPLSVIADYKALLHFTETGEITESQAVDINRALLRRGLITTLAGRASYSKKRLIDFLLEYWDYDNSPALRDKRAHGKQVLKQTCHCANKIITAKWKPYFGDKMLCELTRDDLREFGLSLKEKGLAGKSINCAIFYGTTALKWAYFEKIISENITLGIGGFKGGGKKRDIITKTEWEQLADPKHWQSIRGYAGFMLASTSGLRNGEIRALRRQDIEQQTDIKILKIKHSINIKDGLKGTKTNEERIVYLLPEVRKLLTDLLAENPHADSTDQFIFYHDARADIPCKSELLPRNLYIAMKNAGIDPAGRKLDLHALRHYFTKVWADKTGDLRQVAKLTGHKTLEMTAHYASHTTEAEILQMGDEAVNIFPFRNRA